MGKKHQSRSLSIRSIGTGEIERLPSAESKSPVAKNENGSSIMCNEDECSFVVRNFRALTSKWLHYPEAALSLPETKVAETNGEGVSRSDTVDVRTDSNTSLSTAGVVAEGDKVVYDLTTDLAYHNSSEREGANLVHQALTPDERERMPDNFMPLRHYRAEKGDVEKAIAAIKHTLKWRKEFEVDKIVSAMEDDVKSLDREGKEGDEDEDFAAILRKENETGKIYVRGYDKDGRALMYMRPGNENTGHEENNMRHLVFQIEKAVACSGKNGHGKICLVIDYDGFAISKTPSMSASKRTLTILQQHFCERMYRAYICNPPMVFRSFYAMIKPFVDPVTKQKVCWCVGKKGLDQIVSDVGGPEKADKQLEKCFSGGSNVRDFDSVEYNRLPLTMAFDENVNY